MLVSEFKNVIGVEFDVVMFFYVGMVCVFVLVWVVIFLIKVLI